MFPTILRKLHDFSRILMVRVVLIALMAIAAVALAKVFGAMIPPGISYKVGADAVDRILSIIANSMLTVTTFSLTVMVATHRAVAGLWTPRAHQILLEDTTTHTVLATFVGAYLYALTAIVLRQTEVFMGEELIVLFGMTLVVALLVVVAIVRWIGHLEMLGSLIETAGRIEQRTATAWQLRCDWPALGAHPYGDAPSGLHSVTARHSGYLKQVYQDRLQAAAEEADARIWVTLPVGTFVHAGDEIARTDVRSDALFDAVRENLSLGSLRNYTQDPEFGLLCLSEIGSRALSPGVNDPGTGVDAIRRITRVILDHPRLDREHEITCERIYIHPFDAATALQRTLAPLARDGAAFIEVQLAFARAMRAIEREGDPAISDAARSLREMARSAARDTLPKHDLQRLAEV